MTATSSEGVKTFKHKYKWTTEEISVVSVLWAVAIGSFAWSAFNGWPVGFIILGVAALAIGFYAFHIGHKRKSASALTATYDTATTLLKVDGHVYEGQRNNSRLSAVKLVVAKTLAGSVPRNQDEFAGRDLLIFTPEEGEGKPVSVPLRMLADTGLVEVLQPVIDQHGTDKAKEAAEFGKAFKL